MATRKNKFSDISTFNGTSKVRINSRKTMKQIADQLNRIGQGGYSGRLELGRKMRMAKSSNELFDQLRANNNDRRPLVYSEKFGNGNGLYDHYSASQHSANKTAAEMFGVAAKSSSVG